MSNFFIRLLSLCFSRGEARLDFLETTKSDLFHSARLGIGKSQIYVGAIAQSARAFASHPMSAGIAVTLSGTYLYAISGLGNSALYFLTSTLPILAFGYSAYLALSKLRALPLGSLMLLQAVAISTLQLLFTQEQTSVCSDCEVSSNQFMSLGYGPIAALVLGFLLVISLTSWIVVLGFCFKVGNQTIASVLFVSAFTHWALLVPSLFNTHYFDPFGFKHSQDLAYTAQNLISPLAWPIFLWLIISSFTLVFISRVLRRKTIARNVIAP